MSESPESGPRILFFSGGTALRELSGALKRRTFNSVHIITPFDSGGSSAPLRAAFQMLSVGDLRNRLLALADETVDGNGAVARLLAHRLPGDLDAAGIRRELETFLSGDAPLFAGLQAAAGVEVRGHLHRFVARMPEEFDLRRASIGNLVLTGCYLEHHRDIHAALRCFSGLVPVRGRVVPVTSESLQLAARLEDGTRIVGQHLLTGKEGPPLSSPIVDLWLAADLARVDPVDAPADPTALEVVREADLICYPMGSFYSSLLANLLPRGVGRAVQESHCPKLYIPNMGDDPEQLGLPVHRCVEELLRHLHRDAGADAPARSLLNAVVIDAERGVYARPVDIAHVEALGVEVVDAELVDPRRPGRVDAGRLTAFLLARARSAIREQVRVAPR
ncbi:MAG: GAK system CofD-like protein [Planctomycetota bacterium]